MKKAMTLAAVGAALLVLSCQKPCQTPKAAPVASSATSAGGQATAMVGAMQLGDEAIKGVAGNQLQRKRSEMLQDLFRMRYIALMQAVDKHLMENAAKKEGLSVEELFKKHVTDKIEKVSDDDVKAFYEAHDLKGHVELTAVYDRIAQLLAEQKSEGRKEAFLDELRTAEKVTFKLVPPDLPREKVDLSEGASWGSMDAPIVVVEYSDYECPYCARTSRAIEEVSKEYGNKVTRIFRHFPLSSHPRAKSASVATECARAQGKFWDMHHLVFQNQHALQDDHLKSYAKKSGLDEAKFEACYASEAAKQAVEKSMHTGMALGIDGTPTLFINGMRLVGFQPKPLLKAYFDAELHKEKK